MRPLPKLSLRCLALAGLLSAGPLSAAFQPDLTAQFITVTYSAGSDSLSASGTVTQYVDGLGNLFAPGDPTFPLIPAPGGFVLDAVVDDSGTLLSGSFSASGELPSLPAGPGVLLSGDLLSISATGGGPVPGTFLFTIDETSLAGPLAADFAGAGFINLGSVGTFPGDFTTDFTTNDTASADIFVPEPGVYGLLAGTVALAALAIRRRFRTAA